MRSRSALWRFAALASFFPQVPYQVPERQGRAIQDLNPVMDRLFSEHRVFRPDLQFAADDPENRAAFYPRAIHSRQERRRKLC